jgi:photosystem I P700 chlorophyll a apoprotein A2
MVVYNWFRTNQELYGSIGYYYYHLYYLLVGYLQKIRQVYGFKNNESRLNHHLSGLLGVGFISLDWSPCSRSNSSRGVHIGWDNFLTSPHPAGLAPFIQVTGQHTLKIRMSTS